MDTVIQSKGMTLLVISTMEPVRMGQKVSPAYDSNSIFTVIGGSSPVYNGAAGRVYVKNDRGMKSEVAPNVLGMAWRVL